MDLSTQTDIARRLASIEGHLAGVRRMIENDAYCVDILKQSYAIRRAIEKLEAVLLERHLNGCVVKGIREGREDEVMRELLELYALNNK
ncbi:MAG: metal-sensitive transcriptional regulator [Dehalococcoidia bacterium]|nr:metal-sensitive transcriptional regulator [Dehalococcoidia bacterium]